MVSFLIAFACFPSESGKEAAETKVLDVVDEEEAGVVTPSKLIPLTPLRFIPVLPSVLPELSFNSVSIAWLMRGLNNSFNSLFHII